MIFLWERQALKVRRIFKDIRFRSVFCFWNLRDTKTVVTDNAKQKTVSPVEDMFMQ